MWNQVEQSLRESMSRVFTKIAMLLPGILAFIVALLIFIAIGWLFALIARRLLLAVKFDERIGRGSNAISEWSPTYTPTLLVTRVVFWGFVIIGVLLGLSAFEAGSTEFGISAYVLP